MGTVAGGDRDHQPAVLLTSACRHLQRFFTALFRCWDLSAGNMKWIYQVPILAAVVVRTPRLHFPTLSRAKGLGATQGCLLAVAGPGSCRRQTHGGHLLAGELLPLPQYRPGAGLQALGDQHGEAGPPAAVQVSAGSSKTMPQPRGLKPELLQQQLQHLPFPGALGAGWQVPAPRPVFLLSGSCSSPHWC